MIDAIRGSVLISGCACFGCFTWGTLFHFSRKKAHGTVGAWIISLASCLAFALFVWESLTWKLPAAWGATLGLFAGALAVWAWTTMYTRAHPPPLAFTDDEPGRLNDRGPYR